MNKLYFSQLAKALEQHNQEQLFNKFVVSVYQKLVEDGADLDTSFYEFLKFLAEESPQKQYFFATYKHINFIKIYLQSLENDNTNDSNTYAELREKLRCLTKEITARISVEYSEYQYCQEITNLQSHVNA